MESDCILAIQVINEGKDNVAVEGNLVVGIKHLGLFFSIVELWLLAKNHKYSSP